MSPALGVALAVGTLVAAIIPIYFMAKSNERANAKAAQERMDKVAADAREEERSRWEPAVASRDNTIRDLRDVVRQQQETMRARDAQHAADLRDRNQRIESLEDRLRGRPG